MKAVFDFDDDGTARKAGDEWLFEGPGTYIPRKEVAVEEQITAHVIGPDQAIRLCAKKEMADRLGQQRVTGEHWLIKQAGAYLPLVYETVVKVEKAHVLTDKRALHLRALKTFTDDFGHTRNNGEEWLVTREQSEAHILNVYEELVTVVDITVLDSRQYCVVLNPFIGESLDNSPFIFIHLDQMEEISWERREWSSEKSRSSCNRTKNWKKASKMCTSSLMMKV